MKKLVVGILNRNRGIEVSLLLQSLLLQTYQDFDIIIIDDNSNNFLYENQVIQGLIQLHKNLDHDIKIIKGEQKGPHFSGQKLFENSEYYDFVLRLDDDVVLQTDCIENLIKYIDDRYISAIGLIHLSPYKLISEQILNIDEHPNYLEYGKIKLIDNSNIYVNGILNTSILINLKTEFIEVEHLHSGFLYRRKDVENIGGYYIGYSRVAFREESDLSYRLHLNGGKILISPKAFAFHYHTIGGIYTDDNGQLNKKELWENDEKIFIERFKNDFKKELEVEVVKADVVNKNNRSYPNVLSNAIVEYNEKKEVPLETKLIHDLAEVASKQIDNEIMNSYKPKIHLVTVTHGNHEKLNKLIESIHEYTNTIFSWTIVNNDTSDESYSNLLELLEHHQMNIVHIQVDKELSVSEVRNEGARVRPEDTEYICFIDDDALVLGKWSEKDWLKQLYELFISEKDIGAVSPIYTWFEPFQSYVISVACLFTSTKVWEQVGGFDPIFGNKEKGTWGWEDNDWSYRVQSLGYKLKRINDEGFPFYHEDTTLKEKADWQEKGIIKGKELLLSKYNVDDINKFKRVVYPFTDNQMNCFGKKLNIGCYHMKLNDFINIDINPECEPDILGDVRELEFENESIDLILASQVLEHFDLLDVKFLLSKFYKWLKHNSHLIIEVPDVGTILDMVEKGKCKLEDYYEYAIYGNQFEIGMKHKSQFDETLLMNMLKEAGFNNITRNYKVSNGLDDISLRFDVWKN